MTFCFLCKDESNSSLAASFFEELIEFIKNDPTAKILTNIVEIFEDPLFLEYFLDAAARLFKADPPNHAKIIGRFLAMLPPTINGACCHLVLIKKIAEGWKNHIPLSHVDLLCWMFGHHEKSMAWLGQHLYSQQRYPLNFRFKQVLCSVITAGLQEAQEQTPKPWPIFLAQGLYDPRIFANVTAFVLDDPSPNPLP